MTISMVNNGILLSLIFKCNNRNNLHAISVQNYTMSSNSLTKKKKKNQDKLSTRSTSILSAYVTKPSLIKCRK